MLIPDFKRKIVGCIDLLFLFPRGVAAIKGEKATAIKTFALLTIIFWPLAPITAAMVPPVGFEGLTYGQQVLNIFFHDIISLILSLAFSWQVAGFLEKRERYWLAMEVGAWVSAFFTVLVMIPLLYVDYHKLAPTEASSCWMFSDSGGCEIASRCAARPKCSSSASTRK